MRIRRGLFTSSQQLKKSKNLSDEWNLYHLNHLNHGQLSLDYLNSLNKILPRSKRNDKSILLDMTVSLRADIALQNTLNPWERLNNLVKLHAVEQALHPHTAAIVIVDRGVYAEKAIRIAKKNGHRTILLCEPEEVTWRAASLADHVLCVSDLGNLEECMQVIEKFETVMDLIAYSYCIDPGFGKLSENPALPAACVSRGYRFSGPLAAPMAEMGNKKTAKELAEKCGVPVVPGYFGKAQDIQTLLKRAETVGLPLVVKKGRSGGGYGNKFVYTSEEFCLAAETFRAQDVDEPIFFEQYLSHPLHVEIQIVIAQGKVILVGSRNCSLQRDCQKTIEEAPAIIPELPMIERYALDIANRMMQQGYTHLATLEFLVQDGKIYFLEVNPRIQVEHGITEAIHHNLDLIALKHWISGGGTINDFLRATLEERNLPADNMSAEQMIQLLRQHSPHQFAIEARVEAIEFKFQPNGKLQKLPVKGVVTDVVMLDNETPCGVMPGSVVNTLNGNPLLATVIGKGANREAALQDLHKQLWAMHIGGIPTNLQRLRDNVKYLIEHPELVIDTSTTRLLDQRPIIDEPIIESSPVAHGGLYNPHLLFKERNLFASSESRLPVEEYVHKVGRGGAWD